MKKLLNLILDPSHYIQLQFVGVLVSQKTVKTQLWNNFWASFPKNMLYFSRNMAFFPFFDDFELRYHLSINFQNNFSKKVFYLKSWTLLLKIWRHFNIFWTLSTAADCLCCCVFFSSTCVSLFEAMCFYRSMIGLGLKFTLIFKASLCLVELISSTIVKYS